MHLRPPSRAWLARVAAAWAAGLGVIGVAGAAAHDAPQEVTVRVEGAVYGEEPGTATEEAQASTTVATSAPGTPATTPGAPTPPSPPPSPSTSEVATAPPTSSQPTTTTRASQTTTSVPTPPTSSSKPPTTATYYVTNSTASTAVVVINDVTHRVLPDQPAGPFTTTPRSMGEAGGDEVVLSLADDPTCGVADSDRYFHAGATFDVQIFESPGFCFGLPTAHAPSFSIASRLPTTG